MGTPNRTGEGLETLTGGPRDCFRRATSGNEMKLSHPNAITQAGAFAPASLWDSLPLVPMLCVGTSMTLVSI